MLREKRAVALPDGRGIFRQSAANRCENFDRLANNLIDQVERKEPRDSKNAPPDQGPLPVELGDFSGLSPAVTNTAISGRRHVKGSTSQCLDSGSIVSV